MDYIDAFVLIIGMIGWGTAIMILRQSFYWKNKHEKSVDMWTTECDRKNKLIEELENKLEIYEKNERTIKIEKVITQPKEYSCKFPVNSEYIDDSELFKKICLGEVSRYIAEELEKSPYLYKLYFEKNPVQMTETVTIRFRLLPYPEEAVPFESLELGRPAVGMAWDKLRYN